MTVVPFLLGFLQFVFPQAKKLLHYISLIRMLLLCFLLFPLSMWGQITGSIDVCVGINYTYSVSSQSGLTYQWSLSSVPTGTLSSSNNIAGVTWTNSGASVLTVTIFSGSSQVQQYSLNINVHPAPLPFITYNNNVACQYIPIDHNNTPSILNDSGGCVKVCAYSAVAYTGNSIPGITGSTYDWTISGGSFNAPGGPLTATGTTVNAYWDAPGQGYIKIKETTSAGCTEEKLVCIEIIETPSALFTTGLPYASNADCDKGWEICLNQTVYFTDLSTAASSAPIAYRDWDFGDGSPHSALQNPSHTYTTPGIYFVTLTITNDCNCKSTYTSCILVKDEPGPPIFCPSVVCENSVAYYSTNANCSPSYLWSVTGGNIVDQALNPLMPPYSNIIAVHWDNVGPSGFGTITLDGTGCDGICTATNTVSVPVVLAQGTINGPANICTDKYFKYKLPAWPATNFTWTLNNNNNGATITSYADNGNEIEVLAGAAAGGFTIYCTYYNTLVKCGGTATLQVQVVPTAVIHAPQKSCEGAPIVCTLNPPTSLTGVTTWTVTEPVNGTQTQVTTTNTTSVTLPGSLFSSPGYYLIEAANATAFCAPDAVTVEVIAKPAPPQTVTGPTPVCLFYPYTYTATAANPNIIFYWEAIQNNTVLATASGANFALQWTQQGPKEVRAYREYADLPGCRSNATTLTVADESIAGNFNGAQQVCADATNNYSFSYTGGEAYFWKLSNPAYGSISAGQGTSNVSVLWNHTTTSITVDLICIVTKCGLNFPFYYQISIVPQPSFTLMPSPSTQCENIPVNFTISSTPAASISSIAWNFGDGNTTTTSATNTSHAYTFAGNQPQNFTVSATISHTGCAASSNIFTNTVTTSVTILPAPDVNLTPGGGVNVCTMNGTAQQMGPFVLTLSSSGGSIVWYRRIGGNTVPIQSGGTTCTVFNATTAPFVNTYFFAEVTGSNGCVTRSNEFLISYVNCVPPASCSPVPPAGWNPGPAFIVNNLSCSNGVATLNIVQQPLIQGTMGGNLLQTEWYVYPAPGLIGPLSPSVSTNNKQQVSPAYQFSKPGDYVFTYSAYYQKQGGAPGEKCLVSHTRTFTVPLIADFTMKLVCNGTNNGYDLTLTDFTAAHPAHTVTVWEWYVDNMLMSSTQPVYFQAGLTTGVHSIKLIAKDAHGHSCERTQTITVPQLPVAAYTVTTTDPLSTPSALSSCEKRAVHFTSSSTGSIVHYDWQFGDGTSSWIAPVTTRVYDYTTFPFVNPLSIVLTITDAYGCTSIASDTIEIIENNIGFLAFPLTYTPHDQILCAGNLATVQLTSIAGGTPPFSYDWYESTQLLGAPSSATLSNISAPGAYWVAVEDAHGCQANANPTPATVNFINTPPVIIQGAQHLCDGGNVQLSAAAYAQPPATLSYSWVRNPGNIAVGNTKDITETGLPPGIYTYTLTQTYTQTPGGQTCVTTSAPYTVEVHALPAPPTLSLQLLDCNTYEIELTASHPFAPPYTFNWSTGQSGSPISVFHGGPYRAWVTDLYGCKSHEDIDVPIAPNTFFWRFPQNACYSFCYEELPRQIDGPSYEVFNTWEWLYNGTTVSANGPYNGSGTNSVCDPLWLDDVPNGMGAGVYQWTLGNTLCIQTSDPMDISLHDCCRLDVEALLECIDPVNHIYNVNVFASGYSNSGTYNLSVTDANGQPIGFFLPPNNTGLAPAGSMNIVADMQLFQLSSPITICVEITDASGFKCTGCVRVIPPLCDDGHRGATTLLSETEEANHSMMLIPNPAHTQVEIEYDFSAIPLTAGGSRYIRITDAVGKTAATITAGQDKGSLKQDVSTLASGVYMVQAIWNGKVLATQKLIVQH